MGDWLFCPRCGRSHPHCKCYNEVPNVPSQASGLSMAARAAAITMADGGEVPQQESPINSILNSVPQSQGSYADASQALNQPIHEGMLGNPQENGEHVLAHAGLQSLLAGELSNKITKAADRAELPELAGVAGLGHVEKVIGKHQDAIASESESAFDGKNPKSEEKEPRSVEDHKELVSQINMLANNAPGLIDRIDESTKALHAVAPQTAASTQQAAARAIQFLSSKAAQPILGPLDEPHEPSPSEIAQFDRYFSAVENPKIALQQIKNGTIGPETVEAVQTVYPMLYDKMKQAVIENLKPETPYSIKMAASQFLRDPMDSTLTPQRIASLQRSFYISTEPQQPQPQKSPKASASGMAKLDISGRTSLKPQNEE